MPKLSDVATAMVVSNLQRKAAGIRTRVQGYQIINEMRNLRQLQIEEEAVESGMRSNPLYAAQAAGLAPVTFPDEKSVSNRVDKLESEVSKNNDLLTKIAQKQGIKTS